MEATSLTITVFLLSSDVMGWLIIRNVSVQSRMTTRPVDFINTFAEAYPGVKVLYTPILASVSLMYKYISSVSCHCYLSPRLACSEMVYLSLHNSVTGVKQGGTCIMVGDDQNWISEASEVAAATLGCQPFSKTLFHIPTGGSHDQETFNHESFEIKCAGENENFAFSME